MNNVDNKIGAGTSCIVKKVKSNNNNDENVYAAKIVNRKSDMDTYKEGMNILKLLDNENIVKIIDEYIDEENIVMIQPYLSGGTLDAYVKLLKTPNMFIGFDIWKNLALQICSAIKVG